jgi:hypothetical protein
VGNVVRLSKATKRRAGDHRLFEVATHEAAAVRALGLDTPRRNGVDPNFSRTQFEPSLARDAPSQFAHPLFDFCRGPTQEVGDLSNGAAVFRGSGFL